LHRFTGVALFGGFVSFAFFLLSASFFPQCYAFIVTWLSFPPIQLLLWGWVWCLFYHLSNGIRHLIWDTGRFLELPLAGLSGHFGFCLSVLLTFSAFLVFLG
jgi:succinate dehydrogenase / fumarate reductase cytochrome b subunit